MRMSKDCSCVSVRPWLLPEVYARIQSGQGELLPELRPAVALFLRFDGIAYEDDQLAEDKLDRYIRWVQHLLVCRVWSADCA